jgi:RimJ/RimL family protein N-acetyltransferase
LAYTPLFKGKLVKLTAPIPDQDAEIEARWTHDLDYMHLVSSRIARPLSPQQIKKKYTELEKENNIHVYHFALRTTADDQLTGFLRLHHIDWGMGNAFIKMGIANPTDRGKGFGSEALALGLRFAFGELNMRRVGATSVEYNLPWIELLKKTGFTQEVCRREAFLRGGRRWDSFIFGLLRDEWMPSLTQEGEVK